MSMRYMMPLCNSSFAKGNAVETIMAMEDEDQRKIAWGEYCYFSGKPEAAVKAVSSFLKDEDEAKMLSASMICTFAYLSLAQIDKAREVQAGIRQFSNSDIEDSYVKSGVSFANMMSSTLLHMQVEERYPLCDNIKYLPEGIRI